MKYLFIGLGSIGKRHLENLRELTNDEIIAYRSSKKNDGLGDKYGIKEYYDFDETLKQNPDVVFITNPTKFHMRFALKIAKNNCHLFIEKPISHNLEKIDELLDIMNKNKKICYVGFNFRFHPNLIKINELIKSDKIGKVLFARMQVGQYLPDWHPDEDYRKSYSARKDLGGGVVLTLIHELDCAHWLFGEIKSVIAYVGKLSSLDIDVEDTASIIMKTKNGAFLEIHLDYIQKPLTRTCEIVGEKGKIEWNYTKNTVRLYLNKEKKLILYKEKKFRRADMFKKELKHFLNIIKKGNKNNKSNDIKHVMKIVEAIKKSSKKKKSIEIKEFD